MPTQPTMQARCPHCGKVFVIRRPKNAGRYAFRCTACEKMFAVEVKETPAAAEEVRAEGAGTVRPQQPPRTAEPLPADLKPAPKPRQPEATREVGRETGSRLTLYRKRRFRKDEAYTLRPGCTTIGAQDDEMPSDIMVADSYMSRRSVSITAEVCERGTCRYLFRVERSTNPVFLCGDAVSVGTAVYLRAGDTFRIGTTDFHVE